MTSFPPPVLLRETDSAQGMLTCTLCHELAMEEPVMTPCDHVFCRSCISQALEHKRECPNDRKELYVHQLQPLPGILRRIWEQVGVKCPDPDCAWTGTVGNYANHRARCGQRSKLAVEKEREYNDRIMQLELQVAQYEDVNRELRETIHSLRKNIISQSATTSADDRTTTIQELKETIRILRFQLGVEQGEKRQRKRVRLIPQQTTTLQFDGSYKYGRGNVCELTQLIDRYHEDKPHEIDPNRIYGCVRKCYQAFQRGHGNNSHTVAVQMLLRACLGCTWFTTKQRGNIKTWCTEQGWDG
jgi:Zinc finger, C3HC4 type (RING finger)